MKAIRIFILLTCFAISHLSFAGAWNRKKNHGYSQVSFTYLSYNRLLNGTSEAFGLKRRIYDHTVQLYAEYGISNRFNLILNVPYKFTGSGNPVLEAENDPFPNDTLKSGMLQGFSNLQIGVRYVIFEKKYILSAQLILANHQHSYEHSSGLRVGYDSEIIRPSLLFGRGWDKTYIQGELGAAIRGNNYAQNCVGFVEGGIKSKNEKTFFIFRIDWKVPVTNGTYDEENSIQTGLFRDNSSFVSPGIKINQSITKHIGINVAGYGAFFSEFEGAAATLNAGLSYEW